MSRDAIVVGAGICGAAAAFFLQERGADVLLLDRTGVSSGSTGLGEGNVLVSDKPPGPERDFALLGRELWHELDTRFPAARVAQKGALILGHPDGDEAVALEPELAPGTQALLEEGDLQVDAAGLARALASTVPLREDADVVAVTSDSVTLVTGERLGARHVLVATGAWAGALTGLPVEPRKGQLVALSAPPGLVRHKLIELAYQQAAAATGPDLFIASVIEQTLDGDEVIVGSSRERVGWDLTVREAVSRVMVQRAARWVPALCALSLTRAWCGFRPWLPDGLPAVGQLGNGVWTSTGHEGSGVCLGPISGRLLAQAITGEQPEFDLLAFDPRRFA